MPVSSRGAPGSRCPVDGVSSADRSGGGGGRPVTEPLGSEPTVLDFLALSGPLAAEYGTLTRIERVLVGETRTRTLSALVDLLLSKRTVRTLRRRLPVTRRVPPAWTRVSPEQSEAHLTPEITGSGV